MCRYIVFLFPVGTDNLMSIDYIKTILHIFIFNLFYQTMYEITFLNTNQLSTYRGSKRKRMNKSMISGFSRVVARKMRIISF